MIDFNDCTSLWNSSSNRASLAVYKESSLSSSTCWSFSSNAACTSSKIIKLSHRLFDPNSNPIYLVVLYWLICILLTLLLSLLEQLRIDIIKHLLIELIDLILNLRLFAIAIVIHLFIIQICRRFRLSWLLISTAILTTMLRIHLLLLLLHLLVLH